MAWSASSHAAGAACAGRLVVTNGRDANPHPPPGSLRYVLDHARRDDTVTFCGSTVVQLVAPLDIVSGEDGVTVTGGQIAGEGGEGIVRVTADRVKFTNDRFAIRLDISGADDTTLSNVEFNDPFAARKTNEAAIEVGRALRLTLDHVTVNTIEDQGVDIQGSSHVTIVDSTFSVMHHTAIMVDGHFLTSGLTIRHTTSDGVFALAPIDGLITDNTINAGTQGHGIVVAAPGGDNPVRYSTLTVSENTLNAASIDVHRSKIAILHNTIAHAGGYGIDLACDPSAGAGALTLTDNTVQASRVGVQVRCADPHAQVDVTGGAIQGNHGGGLNLAAPEATVRQVTVSANQGTGVAVQAASTHTTLADDTITANRGTGVLFKTGSAGVVAGGHISANRGLGGIAVERGARVRVTAVSMSGDAGAGLDVVGGPPPPKLVYSHESSSILGTTCGGCVVEAYTIESGPRTGHPNAGEGSTYLDSLRADGDGRFRYHASCPKARTLTFTATQLQPPDGGRTSGFSQDVQCFAPINHLEVTITCAVTATKNIMTVSNPITVTDPKNSTPVDYVASFPRPQICGTQSYGLINADTGKSPGIEPVIFLPDTTAYATDFSCVDHPTLTGCAGKAYPGSQQYVVGLVVTNNQPENTAWDLAEAALRATGGSRLFPVGYGSSWNASQ
jgi:hypothetical protein